MEIWVSRMYVARGLLFVMLIHPVRSGLLVGLVWFGFWPVPSVLWTVVRCGNTSAARVAFGSSLLFFAGLCAVMCEGGPRGAVWTVVCRTVTAPSLSFACRILCLYPALCWPVRLFRFVLFLVFCCENISGIVRDFPVCAVVIVAVVGACNGVCTQSEWGVLLFSFSRFVRRVCTDVS